MSEGSANSSGRPKGANAEKRERILKAAIEVFAQKGFYATRVSEIASAAGVADGTIYLYFENKDDVLVSIFEDRIGKLLEVLREVATANSPVDEKIERIIALQLGLLEEQRDLAEVITVCLRQSSKLLKQFATPLFSQYLELIAGVIEEGQTSGIFRTDVSPRVAARSLWGALDGLALTWALSDPDSQPDPAALRRAAAHVGKIFLGGVRSA